MTFDEAMVLWAQVHRYQANRYLQPLVCRFNAKHELLRPVVMKFLDASPAHREEWVVQLACPDCDFRQVKLPTIDWVTMAAWNPFTG
jgi:hypothetical protein